ncbi:hypothetical protein CP8484711_1283A, partial [Chlamydia psittaci 84-8471/1]
MGSQDVDLVSSFLE